MFAFADYNLIEFLRFSKMYAFSPLIYSNGSLIQLRKVIALKNHFLIYNEAFSFR